LDVIEDNTPETINQSVELMKSCIPKIESLRMQYRAKHQEIKLQLDTENYEQRYEKLDM